MPSSISSKIQRKPFWHSLSEQRQAADEIPRDDLGKPAAEVRSAWFTLSWRMITVLFDHRLPATTFVAERSETVARCHICSLPELSNPVDDLLPLPLVNRYFESRLARGRPDKGNCQVAAYIRLWLCLLRCFQDFEKLPGLGGGLET